MALYKAYVPRWVAWFGFLFTAPMWVWITWSTFFDQSPDAESLSVEGWLLVSLVLGAVLVLLVLLGTRRLPAYLVEIPDEALGKDR